MDGADRGGFLMDVPDQSTIDADTDVPWLITEDKVRDAINRIVAVGRPRSVILFGSYARGESRPGSDLDILVIVDDSVANTRAESVRLRRALRGISMPVDIVVVRHADLQRLAVTPGLLYEHALREGRRAYERR